MLTLSDGERRTLILWSVSLCAASILLAPLAARSSGEVAPADPGIATEVHAPDVPARATTLPPLVIRDPFVADAPPAGSEKPPPEDTSNATAVGTPVVAGTPLGFAPGRALGDNAIVTAIITGDEPEALVEESGRSTILRIGGQLDGLRVTGITAEGIRLADGSVRRVQEVRP